MKTAHATYERLLGEAVAGSKLPDQPNWQRVNSFLLGAYRETWGW